MKPFHRSEIGNPRIWNPEARRRAGSTFVEAQVAFVLLGIGLSGVAPLVVMQLKLSKKIEQGFNPQTAYFRPGTTFYLVPSSDAWERKLGVAAALQTGAPPGWPSASPSTPAYDVKIVSAPMKSLGSESVTLHVSVTAAPPPGSGS